MPQVMTFEKHRVLKNIQIPKLKEICSKEKLVEKRNSKEI